MKTKLLTVLGLFAIQGLVLNLLFAQEEVFSYTGSVQYYTVPDDVGSIQVEAWGAEGGTGVFGGVTPIPGKGGYAVGQLTVTPGEVLEIYVGGEGVTIGAGGFNGGGRSGSSYAGSGGGASDVRKAPYGLDDRVIVAGGGGAATFGSSPSNGGDGGGLNGLAGEDMDEFTGGGGGTQVAGGTAGCCYGAATGGTFGVGGGPGDAHNGGGGGGWYGGGSGAGQASAGGGSSYIEGLVDGETMAGLREGNGEVIITILCNDLSLTVTDYDPCINEYITLTAESDTGGDISWEDGVEDGVPFIPGAPGVYFYTANSTGPDDCNAVVEINVRPFPTVVANAAPSELCQGESLILYGDGAETYEWGPGDITDRGILYPEEGTHTYIATGTDEFGCVADDEVTVVVHPEPSLVITADNTIICEGDEVTLTATGGVEYDWDSPVENGIPFTIGTIGTYTYEVEIEDENGCEAEGEITITVGAPIEITYTVTAEVMGDDGAIDIDVTGGTTPYTFDWDNDGTGDFDDTEDLTGIAGGDYVVVVKDAGTCSGSESMTIETQLGVESLNDIEVNVFPNPTNEVVNVSLKGEFTFTLYSITGQEVLIGRDLNQTRIALNDFESGQYILKIQQAEKTVEIPIIKN
ncbi:glycine-rich protein [Crocinitomix catalasitica]|uniref:glycine-rich protein n=1 Tax=Crocinitomix catalasitica TaxID=184607 RepID=UPI000686AA0E|nr:glycine-rich protein [Crocinitomix catalasitica]